MPRKKTSAGQELPVRDRILNTAGRLFLSQGYSDTGINQIIAESDAARASFYLHFPSKDDLGREYIRQYGERNISLLRTLAERTDDPRVLVKSWARLLRREARSGTLFGCPMANLRSQIPTTTHVLSVETRNLSLQTIEVLRGFLEKASAGKSAKTAKETARKLFAVYEGALQVWRLTGDLECFEDLEDIAERLLR